MAKIESTFFRSARATDMRNAMRQGHSFLLFGPRQTGKSTLLEHVFAELPQERCLRYDLQLPSQREQFEGDPEMLLREVQVHVADKPLYLFVDEIQRAPKLLDVLQYLLDKKLVRLAATGSSARKLRHIGTNWLPGRIRVEYLTPLTWQEAGLTPPHLSEAMRYGLLPAIWACKDPATRDTQLGSYTHLYLEEEIRLEAVVRNIPRFTQFLRLAALESGGMPNYSKIGGRVGLSHTAVREYFQILEDTLIIHRLPAFGTHRDAVLRATKYYFFDCGVRNAAAMVGHSEGIITLQRGVLFEHLVVLGVVALLQGRTQFFFWRSKDDHEVDLVIEHGNRRIACEIKATTKPNEEDFAGLTAFGKRYHCRNLYLICQCDRPQAWGTCQAIPWTHVPKLLT